MPISGARFRFRTTSSGKKQRLAFRGNKVVEVTNFKRGARGKLVKTGPSKRIRASKGFETHMTGGRIMGHTVSNDPFKGVG